MTESARTGAASRARAVRLARIVLTLLILLGAAPAQVARTASPPEPAFQFGADIRPYFLPYGTSVVDVLPSYAARTQLRLIRCCNIDWSTVERVEGRYDWNARQQDYAYTAAEGITKTLYLFQHGYIPMIGIIGVPEWAKQYQPQDAGYGCSPPRADLATYQKFATFVQTLVGKLGQAGVKRVYLQPWNEPDAAVGNVPFGGSCWAATDTPAGFAQGGAAYAEMLHTVRSALQPARAGDPDVSLVAAGLLLECATITDTSCGSYQFLTHLLGPLADGRRGVDALDVLDYHAYAYWTPETDNRDWDVSSSYAPLGRLQGKLQTIRQLLAQQGAPNKPVLLGEGALIRGACATAACEQTFRDRQANYVVRMYARAAGNGLASALWYSLGACSYPDNEATRWGELITICRDSVKVQPGYTTLRFLSNRLAGAIPAGKLTTPPGVEGYAFYMPQSGRTQQIYWTNDAAQTATITLGSDPLAVYDYTQRSYAPARVLTVGFAPLLVELPPGTVTLFLPYIQR